MNNDMRLIFKKISICLLIVMVFVLISSIFKMVTLKINTLDTIKTKIFKDSEENDIYGNYAQIFLDNLRMSKYNENYEKIDNENKKDKFSTLEEFVKDMKNICEIDGKYNSNNSTIIKNIIKKDKYTDTDVLCNFYYGENNSQQHYLRLLIREYGMYNYKIIVVDYK